LEEKASQCSIRNLVFAILNEVIALV